RGLAICACTVEAASAATPDTASLSMSRRSIMKSSRPIVLTSLTPAQHAVENRQAEDHRKRDQRVADRAKRRFAGAAEQRCAELDSQRIDGADHQRKAQRFQRDQPACGIAYERKEVGGAEIEHD